MYNICEINFAIIDSLLLFSIFTRKMIISDYDSYFKIFMTVMLLCSHAHLMVLLASMLVTL